MTYLENIWDMLDDILIVIGVALAVFTPFFEDGVILFGVGLALMWARGEI
ncbi:hypothetical protein HZC09_00215 [Candidatus Micrarchaeota archaeon]|nr:hypothetical protein [Candidatus Micrarchaeota archaeon]